MRELLRKSLLDHAGKSLVKIANARLGTYRKAVELLPEEEYGLSPCLSTMGMISAV